VPIPDLEREPELICVQETSFNLQEQHEQWQQHELDDNSAQGPVIAMRIPGIGDELLLSRTSNKSFAVRQW